MSHFSPLQYSIGLVTTVLLIFLFFQSQLDHRNHENTLIKILSLKEYDSRIKLQIAELQTGYKRNYGGIVATKTHINFVLQNFSDLHSHSDLLLNKNTRLKFTELEQAFKTKLDLIEFFKRENAVLRNSLHYLPKLIDQLSPVIDVSEGISSIDKNLIKVHLNAALVDVLKYNSQINSDVKNLKKRLKKYKDNLQIITPANLQQDIKKIFTHAKLIIKLQASISIHVQSILSNNTSKIAQSLYNEFTQNFIEAEKTSNNYRLWLLVVSLLLLSYLAVVFLKLQHTSENLKQSLTDLEFHKQAIDEHSIVSITDVKGNILYANDKFCNISQYSKDELIGQNHRVVRSRQHDDKFFKEMWRTVSRGNNWHGVFANRARDGSIYWVDSTIIPRINEQGKPYQYIGIRTDITAQKRAEEQAKLLARFPAENPDPVIRFDAVGNLLYANPASKLILEHWHINANGLLPEEWSIIINRCLANNAKEEHEVKINDIYFTILFTPIFKERYVNLYARDITDIKLAEKNLNYQATHDNLTNLSNRYAFEIKLEEALKNAQQDKINSILLYLDLDQFKIVNDTCGHVAG
ncbi:MAG: PAS domain S-box protein, partial [Thiotrichaceae bacterium]|nr:PAS domain S-box protein [Thiotrichaceae bacterium]